MRFDAADERYKGTLDFLEFRRFVKTLNARPELELIFDEITKDEGGKLTFPSFLEFMRNIQKVCLLCGSIVSDLLLMILAIPRLRNPRKTSSSCSLMSLQRPSRSPRPRNSPPPNLPEYFPKRPQRLSSGRMTRGRLRTLSLTTPIWSDTSLWARALSKGTFVRFCMAAAVSNVSGTPILFRLWSPVLISGLLCAPQSTFTMATANPWFVMGEHLLPRFLSVRFARRSRSMALSRLHTLSPSAPRSTVGWTNKTCWPIS